MERSQGSIPQVLLLKKSKADKVWAEVLGFTLGTPCPVFVHGSFQLRKLYIRLSNYYLFPYPFGDTLGQTVLLYVKQWLLHVPLETSAIESQ